ncbi:50S ribosomal protein L4 [Synechococcus sp. C9]|jgi:large subunit ribosomal protein L4|uniref:50S ribosomal protein L4 n=1 Tax=Synechococcus sp. C9 TaxID=102119 RepID=UPI001FF27166|nr:50S ribosomal protein L4 [Synechococcus sp. C9]
MVALAVKNWQGETSGEAPLELRVAKPETANHILHRAVVRQLAHARQGTACTKTRSEVSGGGRKPWRQKGTGRARAGSNRSPLWRGGGVIFGPKPRDYELKMNRKERRLALRTALMNRAEQTIVVEEFTEQLPRPKTKEMVQALSRWGADPEAKILLIVPEITETLGLSVRNLPRLTLLRADQLNVWDILHADTLVVTVGALQKIQEVYGDGSDHHA